MSRLRNTNSAGRLAGSGIRTCSSRGKIKLIYNLDCGSRGKIKISRLNLDCGKVASSDLAAARNRLALIVEPLDNWARRVARMVRNLESFEVT